MSTAADILHTTDPTAPVRAGAAFVARERQADAVARNGSHGPASQDLDAERALLGAMLLHGDAITAALGICGPGDFYGPAHVRIADAVAALHNRGEPVGAVIVRAEMTRADGQPAELADLNALVIDAPPTGLAAKLAEIVREHAIRRQVIATASTMTEQARTGTDVASLLDHHVIRLDGLRRATSPRPAPPNLAAFLAQDLAEGQWVIPGLLEVGDRLIFTGLEGGGKSTALRQMGVQTAAGIHPFTLDPIEPARVLLFDVENSRRLVQRRLAELRALLGDDSPAGEMLHVEISAGVDLLDARSAAQFEATVDDIRPDLLICGPIYKMAGGDPNEEATARAVAAVLDRLRARHGCAVVLEAHTPHGAEERPYGASLWKRWPEYGVFLAPDGALRHWRGQRDERDWPTSLQRGGYWPWTAVNVTDDKEPWNGPTHCADAILELLNDQPDAELGINTITAQLRARGKAYRNGTVSVAAESLVHSGLISGRRGPRNSRLFALKDLADDPIF